MSRLMAKTRRDNRQHTGSGGQPVWQTVTTAEIHCRRSGLSVTVGGAGPLFCSPQSSRPAKAGTRSEVHPPVSEYLRSYQGTGRPLPSASGRPAWAVNEAGQGRVAAVVVGVAPHQGARESRVQGERPQAKAFQAVGVRRY